MITTRHLSKDQPSAALSARERLLHDPQIRRNQAIYTELSRPPEPAVTVTFTANDPLSRAEQEQQALTIARTYKDYYLAAIDYQTDHREVNALLKPLGHTKGNTLTLTVDANGNATIEDNGLPARLSVRRLLLIIGILAAAAAFITAIAGLY